MLILASLSPRRRELMRMITGNFTSVAPKCGEYLPEDISPENAVLELALRKALSIAAEAAPEDIVIGADTVVALDGAILGKPENEHDAINMLMSLSGRTHEVFTGVAIVGKSRRESFVSKTAVSFRELLPGEIVAYVKTGEPMDKAGAYGIQGGAADFAEKIDGDLYNVIGLPVKELAGLLAEFAEI